MNAVIQSLAVVAIAIAIYAGCHVAKVLIAKHKLSGFVKYCDLFGYSYVSYYSHKGKGLIYRKEIPKFDMDCQLKQYDYTALDYPSQSCIYEYVAMIDYPYWEEHFYNITKGLGGRRFFHFFTLVVNLNGKAIQRPFSELYLSDSKGEFLYDCIQIDGNLMENLIANAKRHSLERFVSDELRYWHHDGKHKRG